MGLCDALDVSMNELAAQLGVKLDINEEVAMNSQVEDSGLAPSLAPSTPELPASTSSVANPIASPSHDEDHRGADMTAHDLLDLDAVPHDTAGNDVAAPNTQDLAIVLADGGTTGNTKSQPEDSCASTHTDHGAQSPGPCHERRCGSLIASRGCPGQSMRPTCRSF